MLKYRFYSVFFVIFCLITTISTGEVYTEVFYSDSNSPVEYQEIMVGTELSIIISSDSTEPWQGSIALMGESTEKGILADAYSFAAAGKPADIDTWDNIQIQGYHLYTGYTKRETGNWFNINYIATDIGDCNISFFAETAYEPPYIPTYNIKFTHVPTRDFDGNSQVDFKDFALLAFQWGISDCEDPNWCQGTDIDTNGTVDINDLMLFAYYWLEKTK